MRCTTYEALAGTNINVYPIHTSQDGLYYDSGTSLGRGQYTYCHYSGSTRRAAVLVRIGILPGMYVRVAPVAGNRRLKSWKAHV